MSNFWVKDDDSDSRDYLDAHPEVEIRLFMDWVNTVFGWENTVPTAEELEIVRSRFYPGKTPRQAVDEILHERKKPA